MTTSLRGVNLTGAEWAYTPGLTPIETQHYLWVSNQDIDYLASKGVPFVRLIFSWEIVDWQQMTIDLRGHTLRSSWNCTVAGAAGIVTVTPTADTKTVRARSKTSFGFCVSRTP